MPGASADDTNDPAVATLPGLRAFIADDEPLLLMLLNDLMVELGCEVVGSAVSVDQGLQRAKPLHLDVAVLDVKLDRDIAPLVEALSARCVPVVLATGYEPAEIAKRFPSTLICASHIRSKACVQYFCKRHAVLTALELSRCGLAGLSSSDIEKQPRNASETRCDRPATSTAQLFDFGARCRRTAGVTTSVAPAIAEDLIVERNLGRSHARRDDEIKMSSPEPLKP